MLCSWQVSVHLMHSHGYVRVAVLLDSTYYGDAEPLLVFKEGLRDTGSQLGDITMHFSNQTVAIHGRFTHWSNVRPTTSLLQIPGYSFNKLET